MNMKRAFSFALAFIMVLSLVPAVNAVEETVLIQNNGLTVTHSETMTWADSYEELIPSVPKGGSITWQASSNQIIASVTPGEFLQTGATLTFKNELDITATLRFGYTLTNEDFFAEVRDLDGNPVDKSFEMELDAGKSFTIIVTSPNPEETADSAVLTISDISLFTGGSATVTFKPAENGSYTVDGTEITDETSYTADAGQTYDLSATAASDYLFFGWYNGSEYISYKTQTKIAVSQDTAIWPVFIKNDVAVFGVGETHFQNLTEADTYAKEGAVKTIVLMNNGVLPEGDYTISAGNTLLIPYNDVNTVHTSATTTAIPNDNESLWTNTAWVKPTAYRTLTMAQGAKLTVEGSLNVGGKHSAGPFLTAGAPSGELGMIKMEENSNITVATGGVLYCWGYIYGDGTVTAKNGATVHENIQFTDFRGGNATAAIAMSYLVFPMTQYYVQNIEVAATFEYGAVEEVWASIFIGSNNQVYGTSVKFIGPDPKFAMFVPGENGSVTKTYLPESDRLQLDIDGDGSINPMTLAMADSPFDEENPLNTATFVLPINNNMTINVNSGTTTLNQSLALLPGAELTIAKDAVLALSTGEVLMQEGTELTEKLDENGNVVMTEKLDDHGNVVKDEEGNPVMEPVMVPVMEPVFYTGGYNLIIYDRDQWLSGWVEGEDGIEPIETYYVYNGKRLQPVAFSVTGSYTRTEEDLKDAIVDVNGSLIADGFIYNTVNIEPDETSELGFKFVGSTPFISSEGTGMVVMNNGAGVDMLTMQATQKDTDPIFVNLFMVSIRLQNADGTYLETMGAGESATFTYCGNCDQWYAGTAETHLVDITWIVDGEDHTQEFCIGTTPVYGIGTDPKKNGYEFIGWSTENDNVPEYTTAELPNADIDATYWACFQEKEQNVVGDLSGDSEVSADDLTLLARHIAGIDELTDAEALKNADTNGDGVISSEDLTQLARYIAGIITDWNE